MYTYKLRVTPKRFSDAMINLRCSLYVVILVITVVTIDVVLKNSMVVLALQFIPQGFIVLYTVDSACELFFIYYQSKHKNHFSAAINPKSSIHCLESDNK
eukprot:Pgem_evm1s6312